MNRKCLGCGATLQSSNKDSVGYVIEKKYADATYCERCYKILHYNLKSAIKLDNVNEYVIEEVNKNAKFVCFLIDFLNINTETIAMFKKIKTPKCLIVSKIDLIPKSVNKDKLTLMLMNTYNITNDIIFISTTKKYNTKALINYLSTKHIKNIHILGFTNAGKSSLINELCKGDNYQLLATSLIPNTTIDFIKRDISSSLSIIDTPGFVYTQTLYQDDDFTFLERINSKNTLKPITYQVKPISSLIIEDKIRINSSTNNSMTIYMSNSLNIKRVFTNNEELLEEEKTVYKIPANTDLVIKSLGFINIKKECELVINSKYGDLIEIRNSMFGETENEEKRTA